VEHSEARVETNVERVESCLLSFLIVSFHDWLESFDIVICELLEPEVIQALHHVAEIVLLKSLVGQLDKLLKSCKYPLVRKRKLKSRHSVFLRLESFGEVAKSKLANVPKLVAEVSVANDSLHIQVNAALDHVVQHRETQGVGSALRDSVREFFSLLDDCLLDLRFGKVRFIELLKEDVKRAAVHDLERVNDVSLGF
jgi:hypothetical protein